MNMEVRDYVLALKEKGLTQMQISDGSGITQSSISKIESGIVGDVMSKNYRALQSLYEKHIKQPRKPRQAQASTTASSCT